MATCDVCGEYENLPYQCKRCGQTFCGEHRLPENHDCPGLAEWDDPGGVFDSGFDEGVEGGGARGGGNTGGSGGVVDRVKRRVDRETGTGGIVGYFRNNATYAILAAIWVTFLAQLIVFWGISPTLHDTLFVLRPDALGNVWTVVTSVLSHSPVSLYHIIGNSVVILFFGPLVERAVGSKKFVAFFFASGIVAGLGHVLFAIATSAPLNGILGASGAGFAILGVLTVWRPNMQVLLFFVIPMKIKYLTWGIALVSAVLVVQSLQAGGGGAAGGIAHLAHLIGFAIGLAFGKRNEGLARSAGGGGVSMGGGRGPRGPGGPGGPGGRF